MLNCVGCAFHQRIGRDECVKRIRRTLCSSFCSAVWAKYCCLRKKCPAIFAGNHYHFAYNLSHFSFVTARTRTAPASKTKRRHLLDCSLTCSCWIAVCEILSASQLFYQDLSHCIACLVDFWISNTVEDGGALFACF